MSKNAEPNLPSGLSISIFISVASIVLCLITGWLWYYYDHPLFAITCLLGQTVLISIVIWQACDPFADAAEFIGHQFRLPGSVRGATLDAVASSMPELFTGIFFVVVLTLGGTGETEAARGAAGFSSTVATCAGSAVYNMILIPAICTIFISFYRKSRPTIDIERRVITRDGAWFVAMEILLIGFLVQQKIHWWMGVTFLVFYGLYVAILYIDVKRFQTKMKQIESLIVEGFSADQAILQLKSSGVKVSRDLAARFSGKGNPSSEPDQEVPFVAKVFFGSFHLILNQLTCWLIISVSTLVAAAACYWLVEVTKMTADKMGVDISFVAVILAAAASSIPDTFLSVASARKGDDDGAVSNAFGSNIFDISVCISIPLLVGSYLNDWNPIELDHQGPITGLQIMLASLTVITLLIISHNLQLTRRKAFLLCGLYAIFVAYAVLGSQGYF